MTFAVEPQPDDTSRVRAKDVTRVGPPPAKPPSARPKREPKAKPDSKPGAPANNEADKKDAKPKSKKTARQPKAEPADADAAKPPKEKKARRPRGPSSGAPQLLHLTSTSGPTIKARARREDDDKIGEVRRCRRNKTVACRLRVVAVACAWCGREGTDTTRRVAMGRCSRALRSQPRTKPNGALWRGCTRPRRHSHASA